MTTISTFSNNSPDDYDCSAYEYWQRGAAGLDDCTALRFMYKSISHGALRAHVRHLAATLAEMGVTKGTVVTLCMPNLPVAVSALYAVNYLGAVCSVLHPLTPPESIVSQMQRVGSDVLLAFDKIFSAQHEVLCAADIRILLLSAGAYFSAVERAVIQVVNRVDAGAIRAMRRLSPRAEVRVYHAGRKVPPVPEVAGRAEDVCLYLHSGGTTGIPKTIPVTNRMLNAEANAVIHLTQPPVIGRSTMLMVLPIFHGFGIGVCLHAMLPNGIRVVLQPSFDPQKSVRLIRKNRVTYLVGVPTMYEKMLATGHFCGDNIKSLVNAYSGGDAMAPELKEMFDRACIEAGSPCRLYQGYGLTETVAVCCVNSPHIEDRAGSIGRPAVGVEMCVMDDEGRALGVDERGEICVRGDTVMGGYLDGTPEGVLVTSEGKTWLYTGDCGYVDADGYYHFVGRKKRMSIIAGINVYHQEVEQLAYEVEGVACAAVTEIRLKGKVAVKLWLVPKEGYGERLREAVLAHLKRRLTKYCVPREVAVIESMPRTPLGKVDYRRLSEDA